MLRRLGDLRVLRGVIRGFSEEARTRGFPSPSFGGFGFVDICCDFFIHLAAGKNLIVNIIGLCQSTGNVGFGSFSAYRNPITRPVAPRRALPFKNPEYQVDQPNRERPLVAESGPSYQWYSGCLNVRFREKQTFVICSRVR